MGKGETRMKPDSTNQTLYACVHATEFPLQALRRLCPELHSEPLAIMEGRPPLQTLCSLNRLAQQKGASLGMTRLEAESIPGLRLLPRSEESEATARAVFLECAANFSPRLEDASHGTACSCILDIAGTDRLFGPPETLAERLRAALATAGFRVSVAVSANFHTARLKAIASRGITVIPATQEAASLSKLSFALLDLTPDHAETFAIWGIQTLGELAALPEVELITRLGAQAADLRHLAGGSLPHTFQPVEAQFSLKEFLDFETPVDQSDSLLFVAARMIDCLVARAAARALSLASLELHMKLDGDQVYRRMIRPAIPATDRKFLLKLLQLEIASHPPQSAVHSLTLTAEAGQSSKMQLGLFAPQMPEPSRLDVTIARLKALAGEDRVGSPVLEDSHRPGNFRMENFSVHAESASISNSSAASPPRMVLRRMRPPVPIRVELQATKPIAFRDHERRFKVAAAYGPWKTSGNWWSTDSWNAEEWDVLAEAADGTSVACLLVRNIESKDELPHSIRCSWQLEAFYD
jgi:protein ImuB